MDFNLLEEKNANFKIKLMKLNPSFDIIALCDIHNEVIVHRVSWQNAIWAKKPYCKNASIFSIEWRLDGQILSVGYNNDKRVQLYSHENGILVYDLILNYEFNFVSWHGLKGEYLTNKLFGEELTIQDYVRVIKPYMPPEKFDNIDKILGRDTLDIYAPYPPFVTSSIISPLNKIGDKLPSLLSTFDDESSHEVNYNGCDSQCDKFNFELSPYWTKKFATDPKDLHILLVVEDSFTPCIHLYAYGLYQLVTIPLHNYDLHEIAQISYSDDLQYLLCAGILKKAINPTCNKPIEDDKVNGSEVVHSLGLILLRQSTDVTFLRDDWREISAVSRLLFGTGQTEGIFGILGYVGAAIESVKEAWESVLLEIDSKFAAILDGRADKNGPKFCDELLELLTWGTAGPDFNAALMSELKSTEVSKIITVMDGNYAKILNIMELNLKPACLKLVNNLAQLKTFSSWSSRFGHLLSPSDQVAENRTSDAMEVGAARTTLYDEYIEAVYNFDLKIVEMQDVMRKCTKNFKAFFKWLLSVALELEGGSNTTIGDRERHKSTGRGLVNDEEESDGISLDKVKDIVTFIYDTFDFDYDPNVKIRVHVDKFGQYLKNVTMEKKATSQSTRNNDLLMPEERNSSLVQDYHELLICFQRLCDTLHNNYSTRYLANVECHGLKTCLLSPADSISLSPIHYEGESKDFFILATLINDGVPTLYLLKITSLTSSCYGARLDLSKITYYPISINEALIYGGLKESNTFSISLLVGPRDSNKKSSGKPSSALYLWLNMGALDNTPLTKMADDPLLLTKNSIDITKLHHFISKSLNSFQAKIMSISTSRNLACLYSPQQGRIQMYEGSL